MKTTNRVVEKVREKRTAVLRAPREIREDTKARRAWNAACIAEQEALGLRAVVRYKGSYEEVHVYTTTRTPGRLQMRGICQACGQDHAVGPDNRVALHGYKRPGDGYVYGRCSGEGELAANFDQTLTKAIIKSCEHEARRFSKLEREAVQYAEACADYWKLYDHTTEIFPGTGEGDKVMYDAEQRAAKQSQELARDCRYKAQMNADFAKHLRHTAVKAYGTALQEAVL